MVGVVLVGALLGGIVLISGSDEEEGAGEGSEDEDASGSHPDGEVLVFKFREMFDYDAAAPVNDGRGSSGITPIVNRPAKRGHIDLAQLLALTETIDRSVGYLADGTTKMEQAVGWFLYEGRLHFVLLIRPFERMAHELMKRPGEDLFISFVDASGERVVPSSAPEQIATKDLRVAVMRGGTAAAGWVAYGELPVPEGAGELIDEPKVGWIFSGTLHGRLKQLQRSHIVTEEGVHDPFALDFDARTQSR